MPDAQAFAASQRAKGLEAEVRIYPGAGHGFFNDSISAIYHEPFARDAWTRTVNFFGRQLGG